MATYNDLLEQLTASEKARFAAERSAEQSVRQAEAKVTALTQRLAEMRRSNDQLLRELRAQCEKKLRDTAAKARQAVQDAEQARCNSEGKAAVAEERMEKSERHTNNLEAKVEQLSDLLLRQERETQSRKQREERVAEDRVEWISAVCNQRIDSMSELCKEVQEAAASSMDIMTGEHQEQLTRADMRAEGRSRFQELCSLSKMRGDLQLSQREYETARSDLTDLWHSQCIIFNSSSGVSSGTAMSPGA
eukprot:gnl/MRDRNA2_/MRDRNA2_95258_c0_seq1.p1 gnl/MRDRNA2_/MRDRNA2_95258_c0~~gnl/MRDRNA2_/MRDRNA2_95258_c0_seq1.p1  ORF type:complete len:248 (+),score=69.06 gnl/MRDRNA2_/MRDRNA2_95258_c0_seq1:118-861(+)